MCTLSAGLQAGNAGQAPLAAARSKSVPPLQRQADTRGKPDRQVTHSLPAMTAAKQGPARHLLRGLAGQLQQPRCCTSLPRGSHFCHLCVHSPGSRRSAQAFGGLQRPLPLCFACVTDPSALLCLCDIEVVPENSRCRDSLSFTLCYSSSCTHQRLLLRTSLLSSIQEAAPVRLPLCRLTCTLCCVAVPCLFLATRSFCFFALSTPLPLLLNGIAPAGRWCGGEHGCDRAAQLLCLHMS